MTTAPKVGDGATYRIWTDRKACTIVEVRKNGRELVLQRDKATLLNGANSLVPDALSFSPGGFAGHTSGSQRYSYERDPNGELFRVSLRGNDEWVTVGQPRRSPGGRATIGKRSEHYDFNF